MNWTGNRWGVRGSVVSLALAVLVEQVETQSLDWGRIPRTIPIWEGVCI